MNPVQNFSIRLNGNAPNKGNKFHYDPIDQNKATKFYLNNKTLAVLTGVGIVIAGAGVLTFLTTIGHLPALAAFLHTNAIPHHILKIASISAMTAGGTIAVVHGGLVGAKAYGKHLLDGIPVKDLKQR